MNAHRHESGVPDFRRRSVRWRWIFVGIPAALAALVLISSAAATGPVGTAAGFEDDDGNLIPNGTAATNCTSAAFDWNCFRPLTWNGTAPYQNASTLTNGWQFNGLTDDEKSNSDTGFSGGTKQDDNCATVKGTSAPNKDDLKRIYIAHKTGSDGHIYLMLAWVRVPLNTTSSSAHVGFEFNQGNTACPQVNPPNPDGSLVQRMAGDLLIVYDFAGGSGGFPDLTFRRWIVAPTTTPCEVSGKVPPAGTGCWGPAQPLTSQGFAEGRVNSGSTALDCLTPNSDCTGPTTGTNATLGNAEFGEAGIDLTAAGIFTGGCMAFGHAEGVSRSSGSSGSAAMEDLVGPGNVDIENCRPTNTTTGQKVVITDFAQVTGFAPTGTVTFDLFTNSTCTGTPIFTSGLVQLSASGLASASTPSLTTTDPATSVTFYWRVMYNGDANTAPSTSPCGTEQTTISGNTPGVDP